MTKFKKLDFYQLHKDREELAEKIFIQCDRDYEINLDSDDAIFIRAAFIDKAMKQFLNTQFPTYCNMSESERNSKSERLSLRFN
jgi:hypothetical protein